MNASISEVTLEEAEAMIILARERESHASRIEDDANACWMAMIRASFPREWAGDVRYSKKGKGEPGSPLNAACEAHTKAAADWSEANKRRHNAIALREAVRHNTPFHPPFPEFGC